MLPFPAGGASSSISETQASEWERKAAYRPVPVMEWHNPTYLGQPCLGQIVALQEEVGATDVPASQWEDNM